MYSDWRAQYQQGNTAPAEALLEQERHAPCLHHALQAQIEGETYQQAALDIGRNPNTFRPRMKRAAQLLAAAYGH